jgi:hypothetical protein
MSDGWPSVTRILNGVGLGPDLDGAPPAAIEVARLRGAAVHRAIEDDCLCILEEHRLDAEVLAYLDAYRRFCKETRHEPIRTEFPVEHPAWRYRGRPDRIGYLTTAGGIRRAVLDWKCVASVDIVYVGRQLAGYRLAWDAMFPTERIDLALCVQLRPDGTYRLHDVSGREHQDVFLAALLVYRARRSYGR